MRVFVIRRNLHLYNQQNFSFRHLDLLTCSVGAGHELIVVVLVTTEITEYFVLRIVEVKH